MKFMQRIVSVLLVLLLCLGSVQGNASAIIAERPTVEDLLKAKEEYIKSLPPVSEARTGPDGATAYTVVDGFVIPPDVERSAEYKAGNVRVFIDSTLPALIVRGPLPATQTGVLAATAPSRQAQQAQLDQLARAGITVSNPRQYFIAYSGFSITARLSDLGRLADEVGRDKVHVAKSYTADLANSVPLIGAGPTGIGGGSPGLEGDGLYIGVIDTGIDYTHPDFGGTPSSTFDEDGNGTAKVPYGWDFGDGDGDPMDTNGHGTHVAGIVAADGVVKGVAPKAKIVVAKIVEGGTGSAWSDAIIAAFEYMADASRHGGNAVSAINMSFGSDAGLADPNDPEQQAIENCVAAGIPVALSAGNAGTFLSDYGSQGIYPDSAMVGSPSVTPGAMSVASSENTKAWHWTLTELSAPTEYLFTSAGPLHPNVALGENGGAGYQYVYCGFGGRADDFPDPFPANTIALIQRGGELDFVGIDFVTKIMNASDAGAIAAIVFDNAAEDYLINMAYPDGETTMPAMFVDAASGAALLEKSTDWSGYSLGDGSGRVSFAGHVSKHLNPYVNTISSFSSWGPAPTLAFKPELTAPGGNIWSTVPVAQGSYDNYSGTSMASPHVAAVAALLKDNKDWTPLQIKTALSNTATLLVDPNGDLPGTFASPRAQGAGLINAEDALSTPVFVTDLASGQPNVVLGELAAAPVTFTVRLTNTTGSPVTYATSQTVQSTYNWYRWRDLGLGGPTAPANISADVGVTRPASVVVPAGGYADVSVTLNLSATDLSILYTPFVEGFLSFASVGLPTLNIPYMGYLGDWNDFDSANMFAWYLSMGFNPILDLPLDDPNCFFGNWVYDIPPAGVSPDAYKWKLGVDFYGNYDRSAIAISTQPTSYHLQARVVPLRTSQSLDIAITDGTHVVRPIETATGVPKAGGYYTGWEVPWEWSGENASGTGFVRDGQYYLQYTAQPATIVGQTVPDPSQVMTFPVKLDSVSPAVTITSIDPIPSGRQVNWTVSDAAPSSGIWGFDVWYTDGAGAHHMWVPPTTTSYVVPADAIDAKVYAFDNANNVSSFQASTTHTITARVVGLGTVTPAGTIEVPYGNDQSFAFMPYPGYGVVNVAVDGITMSAAFGFTFKDVVTDHTLVVTFGDIMPPQFSLPAADKGIATSTTSNICLAYTASDNSGAVLLSVKADGTPIPHRLDPSGKLCFTLADGMHTMQISASDNAGNATVKAFLVSVDTVGPVVTIDTPPPAETSSGTLHLTGSVRDAVSGVRSLVVNGQVNVPYLDGTFVADITLEKGTNDILVEATDNAGNTTTQTFTVKYGGTVTSAPSSIYVMLTIGRAEMEVNGMPVALDAAPFIKDSRTLLPIRALIEALGGTVQWNASTRTATVALGSRTVALTIGSTIALVNGTPITLDVAPMIVSGRTFLPLRAVAENLGLDLAWEPVSRTISLTYWP